MKEVLADVDPEEQIFITAISIGEFADLGNKIADMDEIFVSKLNRDDLHDVLMATTEKGIYGKFHEILAERLDELGPPRTIYGL